MYTCLLLSAGRGMRFGKETPKQYWLLAGKPMIVHTLERINTIPEIGEIVIVCEQEYVEQIKTYLNDYGISKKVVFAEGGETRQESVYRGLEKVSFDKVIVHEAARPLVTKKDFERLIACEAENVSYTYKIPYTVLKKDVHEKICGLLDRNELVNMQAPQKFNKTDLLNAHLLAIQQNKCFTDDPSLMYFAGKEVFCLVGQAYNVKMTEYIDLHYGEMLIREGFIKEDE